MNCQNCGYDIKADWKLCPNCGVQLKEDITAVITCRNCGREVKSSWEQCHHCQVDLKGEKKLKFSKIQTLIKRLKNRLSLIQPNKKILIGGVIVVSLIVLTIAGLVFRETGHSVWQKVYGPEQTSLLAVEQSPTGFLLGGAQSTDSYLMNLDQLGDLEREQNNKKWGSIIDIDRQNDNYLLAFDQGVISRVDGRGNDSIIRDLEESLVAVDYNKKSAVALTTTGKLIKLNSNWEIEWSKKLTEKLDPTQNLHMKVNNLLYTSQGNIVVISEQKLYKFSESGTKLWQNSFEQNLYTVKESLEQGLILAGTDNNFNQAYLKKLDQHGQTEWERKYGEQQISIFDLAVTSTGYLAVGARNSDRPTSNGYAAKFSQQGQLQWERDYGGGGDDIFTTTKAVTPQGQGYIIAGLTNSFGASEQAAYVVRINESGDFLQQN
ncbi:MAG: zinc ribbon domain-containing protein [Bacillota bacterium]